MNLIGILIQLLTILWMHYIPIWLMKTFGINQCLVVLEKVILLLTLYL